MWTTKAGTKRFPQFQTLCWLCPNFVNIFFAILFSCLLNTQNKLQNENKWKNSDFVLIVLGEGLAVTEITDFSILLWKHQFFIEKKNFGLIMPLSISVQRFHFVHVQNHLPWIGIIFPLLIYHKIARFKL